MLIEEKHFTTTQLAKAWGVSVDSIRRLFARERGVLRIVRPATEGKRRYVTTTIPGSVARRVHEKMSEVTR